MEHYREEYRRPRVRGDVNKLDSGRIGVFEFDCKNGEVVFVSESSERPSGQVEQVAERVKKP